MGVSGADNYNYDSININAFITAPELLVVSTPYHEGTSLEYGPDFSFDELYFGPNFQFTVGGEISSATPEPASLGICGIGLAMLAFKRRK